MKATRSQDSRELRERVRNERLAEPETSRGGEIRWEAEITRQCQSEGLPGTEMTQTAAWPWPWSCLVTVYMLSAGTLPPQAWLSEPEEREACDPGSASSVKDRQREVRSVPTAELMILTSQEMGE